MQYIVLFFLIFIIEGTRCNRASVCESEAGGASDNRICCEVNILARVALSHRLGLEASCVLAQVI